MTYIAIDLNVRTEDNQTYVGFEDADRSVRVGQYVTVVEPESGIQGSAVVTRVDAERSLIYLAVDWVGLREDFPSNADIRLDSVRT